MFQQLLQEDRRPFCFAASCRYSMGPNLEKPEIGLSLTFLSAANENSTSPYRTFYLFDPRPKILQAVALQHLSTNKREKTFAAKPVGANLQVPTLLMMTPQFATQKVYCLVMIICPPAFSRVQQATL